MAEETGKNGKVGVVEKAKESAAELRKDAGGEGIASRWWS